MITNQIQQLSTHINKRFNDQRIPFENRFTHIDQRIDEVEIRLTQRIDQVDKGINQVDKRINGVESRLSIRHSTWLTIIIAILTLLIGTLMATCLQPFC